MHYVITNWSFLIFKFIKSRSGEHSNTPFGETAPHCITCERLQSLLYLVSSCHSFCFSLYLFTDFVEICEFLEKKNQGNLNNNIIKLSKHTKEHGLIAVLVLNV